MNSNIIKLLYAIENSDYKYLWDYTGMQGEFSKTNFEEMKYLVYERIFEDTVDKIDDYEVLDRFIKVCPKTTLKPINIILKKGKGYIDHCLANKQELNIRSMDIHSILIGYKDKETIDKWIYKRKELGLNNIQIIDIINSIEDKEFTDNCITRRVDLGLSNSDITMLIYGMRDIKYADKWIKNKDEIGLNSQDVFDIIMGLNKGEYTDKCINDRKKLGLDNNQIVNLIIGVGGQKYIEKWIEKKDELELEPIDIVKLICNVPMLRYNKKRFYEDVDELHLDSRAITAMLEIMQLQHLAPQEYTYIKDYLSSGSANKLEKSDLIRLLAMEHLVHKTEYDNEKNEFNLSKEEIDFLKVVTNKEYFKKYLARKSNNYKSCIKLPEAITIGMEIECIGPYSNYLKLLGKFGEWKCEIDGSVEGDKIDELGVEVKSPILTGNQEQTSNNIKNMCKLLKNMGQRVNGTCGGHIHIGADYLTSSQSLENLMELYLNNEKALYLISNKEGEIPREDVIKFAAPMSQYMEDVLDSGEINLEDVEDLEKLKQNISKVSSNDRCRGINFENLAENGIGTIEFRLSNGTVDSDVWIQNINLFGGMVKVAEDIHIIQEKGEETRTKKEKEMLEKFERIRSGDNSEQERLELLLELVITDEDRRIYTDRYSVNSELLHKNARLEKLLDINLETRQKEFNLKKYYIGKKIIGSQDRITGDEIQLTERKIIDNHERNNPNITEILH